MVLLGEPVDEISEVETLLRSMTGFGRGEYTGELKQVVAEIKSVNHRYNEVLVKMPRQYNILEDSVRKIVLNYVTRGRIEVYLKIENVSPPERQVQVDKDLALAYYKALKELAETTNATEDMGVSSLAQLPDILKVAEPEEDMAKIEQEILQAVEIAMSNLLKMREVEGQKLHDDLIKRLTIIAELNIKVKERSPLVVSQYRDKLQARLQELLDSGQVDEVRLATEVAFFADRACIAEEIVRLDSHIDQFKQILLEDNPIGRKLDFLLQEMNREVNTIGSKANDLEIVQDVVEMKSELEKLREQVQNIE